MNASRLHITLALIVGLMATVGMLLWLAPMEKALAAQASHSEGLTSEAQARPMPEQDTAQASVTYVDKDAPGPAHNGLSWATAYTDVQRALTTAISGTEIWVAEGVYYPGAYITSTFVLTDGVALYGGFAATETQRTQRDWAAHVTILSGDIDRNDLTDANGIVTDTVNIIGTNADHVVTGSGVTQTAILDGFTITAGNPFAGWDGGMYNDSSSPALTNVTFSGNKADMAGGGMINYSSNPRLTNVKFSGNRASSGGGGMFNSGSSPTLMDVTFIGNEATNGGGMLNSGGNPSVTNVTFSGNRSGGYGGGMYNFGSNPTLMDVTFSGNQAGGGGGIYNSGSSPMLTNVTFNGNRAGIGGGMYNDSSSPALTNVTFSGNKGYGGGMYNNNSSNPALVNSILWGDSPDEIHNDISAAAITYSDVQGGYVGTGNISADPLFVAPITATAAPTTTGNYRLRPTSPAIDAGNTLSVTVATDLDDHPRVSGAAVDMGAFEYQFTKALTVTKQASPDPVQAGAQLTYTLRVTNTGNVDLHAIITDTLPDHVMPTGILTWTATLTAPDGTWSQPIAVTVTRGYSGTLTNRVQVTTLEEATGEDEVTVNTIGYQIYLPLVIKK